MNIKNLIGTLSFILLISSFSYAQSDNQKMIKDWERAKAYTQEYLDAMPASDYGFKPTPEMRSFAEQMLHLTDTNYGFGSTAFGLESPYNRGELEKTTDKSKANITKIVNEGYDFIINGLKGMTDNQLNEQIKLFGRFDLSKAEVINKSFEHQTHQRGQTTVYLRLKGVTPPAEKLF